MRKYIRSVYCVGFLLICLVFTVSCPWFQPPEQPKPKKPPVKNPVKTPTPKPLPTPKAPDVQSIIQEGIAYRETGKLNKAIASFKEALKYEPNNAEAALYLQETQDELDVLITDHLNKGITYFNEDALEDAIREWDKVLELDPSHQEAAEYKEKAQKRLDALKD